ncbi:WbqC family protein [Thalassomonas sp. RHCl1]|uniref:WbqC family protein n=1 Tax=Thalassomonas sp. RHCl1 TaxID=2995320 RepID=UPI00248C7977|nr:WbqC family protein [Thalassomonas sp. RHCl1]
MKVAIMQPYFFPYLGYFQLIKAVDCFVIFDDVNYIKRGWINKNRIWQHGQITNITLPVQKASQNRKINQHQRTTEQQPLDKIKKQIRLSYSKAPFFHDLYPLLEKLLDYDENNLARYLGYGLQQMSGYLALDTRFVYASELSQHQVQNSAEQRIINITRELGGSEYFNLPGGKALYREENFNDAGIKLNFVFPDFTRQNPLLQSGERSGLSIIDVLMYTKNI